MKPTTHLYYLDTHGGSNWINHWRYYRVTTVYDLHIEVCEVEFPSLKDKGVATQHPLIVGLAAAWDIKGKHLATLGIDQENAILIGMVSIDEKGEAMRLAEPSKSDPTLSNQ